MTPAPVAVPPPPSPSCEPAPVGVALPVPLLSNMPVGWLMAGLRGGEPVVVSAAVVFRAVASLNQSPERLAAVGLCVVAWPARLLLVGSGGMGVGVVGRRLATLDCGNGSLVVVCPVGQHSKRETWQKLALVAEPRQLNWFVLIQMPG